MPTAIQIQIFTDHICQLMGIILAELNKKGPGKPALKGHICA